jgi:hypothetical protein
VLASERDRFFAVARLGDDFVARPLEEVTQIEPDDRFVFRDEDTHGP